MLPAPCFSTPSFVLAEPRCWTVAPLDCTAVKNATVSVFGSRARQT
jgi:hypothetical protein